MSHTLKQFLNSTRHDLKLALEGLVDENLLLDLISLLERGVAVTLIIPSDSEAGLKDEVFLFNKCLIFLKKGGELYFHDTIATTLVVMDYKRSLHFNKNNEVVMEEEQSPKVYESILTFQTFKKQAQRFLDGKDDIHIDFNVTDDIILLGDEITLSWQVKNASTIIIEGIGEVEPVGRKKIKPGVDTIFKIGAYNRTQSGLKTIGVKVYDNISIDYDLSFANPRTQQFSSLVKEDNYPHVFGVAQGNTVKINWQVADSNMVKISPFEICKAVGEHEFIPESNMVIEIEAKVLHRIFRRKIQLLVFPIRVFKEKLVGLSSALHYESYHKSHDMSEVVEEIKNRQIIYNQSLKKIRKAELKKYDLLLGQMHQIVFDNSDNECNLEKINLSFFDKLRGQYAHMPGIARILESLKSYYGKAQGGK